MDIKTETPNSKILTLAEKLKNSTPLVQAVNDAMWDDLIIDDLIKIVEMPGFNEGSEKRFVSAILNYLDSEVMMIKNDCHDLVDSIIPDNFVCHDNCCQDNENIPF
jgi:hypothetical protein